MAITEEDLRALKPGLQAGNGVTPPSVPNDSIPESIAPNRAPSPSLPAPGTSPAQLGTQAAGGGSAVQVNPGGIRSTVFSPSSGQVPQGVVTPGTEPMPARATMIDRPSPVNPNIRGPLADASISNDGAIAREAMNRAQAAGKPFFTNSAGSTGAVPPTNTTPGPGAPPGPAAAPGGAGTPPPAAPGAAPGAEPPRGPISQAAGRMAGKVASSGVGSAVGSLVKFGGQTFGIGNVIQGWNQADVGNDTGTQVEGATRAVVGALPFMPNPAVKAVGVGLNYGLKFADESGLTQKVRDFLGYGQKPAQQPAAQPAQPATQPPQPPAQQPAGQQPNIQSYGTPPNILDGLRRVESSGNAFAVNPTTGAMGAYQFLPSTVAMLHKMGVRFNPFDEAQSRQAADFYYQYLLKENGGDQNKALAAYGGFKTKDPSGYIAGVTGQPAAAGPVTAAMQPPPKTIVDAEHPQIATLKGNTPGVEQFNPQLNQYTPIDTLGPIDNTSAAGIANRIQDLYRAGRTEEAKLLAQSLPSVFNGDSHVSAQGIATSGQVRSAEIGAGASRDVANTNAGATLGAAEINHPDWQPSTTTTRTDPITGATISTQESGAFNKRTGETRSNEKAPEKKLLSKAEWAAFAKKYGMNDAQQRYYLSVHPEVMVQ